MAGIVSVSELIVENIAIISGLVARLKLVKILLQH